MILVTGGCGFIGHHFVARVRKEEEVTVLDAMTYAAINPMPCRIADIGDRAEVENLLESAKPRAVVHLAAESHVGKSLSEREVFVKTNVVGTSVLLEACLEYSRSRPDFRFLHVSTDEVYGSLKPEEDAWTEESPYAPNNPYSASKAASDMLVRSFVQSYNFPAIITHSSNNYGTGQHREKFIPQLIHRAKTGQPLTVHGDGTHIRDWLNVSDHCEGLWLALNKGLIGETYNFGGDCERTNLRIAHMIQTLLGGEIIFTDDRPSNDRRYSINNAKAKKLLGWKPGHPIEFSIEKTIKGYYDNWPSRNGQAGQEIYRNLRENGTPAAVDIQHPAL